MQRNPFEFGRELNHDELVDREEELRLLLQTATNRSKLFLVGPRRMGKSTVLRAAAQDIEDEGGVALRQNAEAFEDLGLLAEALLSNAARALENTVERATQTIRTFFSQLQPEITIDPRTERLGVRIGTRAAKRDELPLLTDVLDGINDMAEGHEQPVVIMLDEFQFLIEQKGESAERLLRATIQEHEHVAYVMAGSKTRMIAEMIGQQNRPFYRLGSRLFLGPIPRSDFKAFIADRFEESGFEVEASSTNYLLELASDVPLNVQQLAHYAWEELRASSNDASLLTREVIDEALYRIVRNDDPLYTQLWNGLTNTQKRSLKAVINHRDEGLYSASVQQKTGMAISSMQAALKVLQEKGFVREEESEGSTQLVLEDPFFAWWLDSVQRG